MRDELTRGSMRPMSLGRVIGVVAVVCGLVAACETLPAISDADVERARLTSPSATKASLQRGKSLYVSRCSSCHEPWAPETRDAATWSEEVDDMAQRAHLDVEGRQLVLDYLTAFASPPRVEDPR